MDQALRVLQVVEQKFGHSFEKVQALVGGAAYDEHQEHFPKVTEDICRESDAILFGSVGGPVEQMQEQKWKNCEANSLLALRKTFNFNANFRPVKVFPELLEICPLRRELVERGIDLVFVRELLGDIYFGEHQTLEEQGKRVAKDTARYDEEQIAAIAKIAFDAAMKRSKKLHSVDKANVLDTSKLWREVVDEVSKSYPEVEYHHILVDNCAMQIIRNPAQFDVLLTPNMFGDILSDAAAVLPGTLGLLASSAMNREGFAMYEPSGGSAQDIAGKGIANPIAQILCVQ